MNELYDVARKYYDAGLNVLPADKATKRPLGSWKQFTNERPAFEAVFYPGRTFDALCLVCGKTSNGLEILDFDQEGRAAPEFWNKLRDAFKKDATGFEFPLERTQSAGLHIGYRSESCGRNQKLALDANGGVLIETRGEGGICLVAPSDGYELLQGDWSSPPTLSDEERETLLECARELDKSEKRTTRIVREKNRAPEPVAPAPVPNGESVADYLRRDLQPMRDALGRAGWRFIRREGQYEQWERPGQKEKGKPGGSIDLEGRFFYCFTSNAAPFEPSQAYSPLDVIALLEHRGDVSDASKRIARTRPNHTRENARKRVYSIDSDQGEREPAESPKREKSSEEARETQLAPTVPFPLELLRAPGMLSEIVELVERRARRPQPGGAFLAAFCCMSYLIGRSVELYCDGATTSPNVYGLFLAPSGMGKEAPRRVASDVAQLYDPNESAPEAFASVQALQNMISRVRKTLWLHDEFGRDLAYMNDQRANANVAGIITESLKLYSNANNRAYLPRLRAQEAAGVKRPEPVDRPFLTIYATGNPRDFFASASETLLHNGYVARFTIVVGAEYSPKKVKTYEERARRVSLDYPAAFQARIGAWRTFEKTREQAPLLVGFTKEADDVIQAYDQEVESAIRRELATVDGATELKARYSEKLWKYALIFAASKYGPREFEVDGESARNAVALVKYEAALFEANAEQFASNELMRLSFDILAWARAVGGTFTKTAFTRKFQRRGTRRDREEVLDNLLDGAYLRITNEGLFELLEN